MANAQLLRELGNRCCYTFVGHNLNDISWLERDLELE